MYWKKLVQRMRHTLNVWEIVTQMLLMLLMLLCNGKRVSQDIYIWDTERWIEFQNKNLV